jgi:hypothetical protein
MIPTSIAQQRLQQLSQLQPARKSKKKKSFDVGDDKEHNVQNNRAYSLATTDPQQLQKLKESLKHQREQQRMLQNKAKQEYIRKSRHNVLAGVNDDEKESPQNIDPDDNAVMIPTKDANSASDAPLSPAPKNISTDAHPPPTAPQSDAKSQSIAAPPAKKKQSKMLSPTVNPTVELKPDSEIDAHGHMLENVQTRKSKGSIIQRMFQRRTSKDDANDEPKRMTYLVKGEKFELYTWLKPTKVLGEGAYAAVAEAIDTRTNKSSQ